ncbi:alpha/beta-Hydrolase [Pochonia chlamydosporia 170]|uniref:Alpha/beta-Hydrolase n=1 Tax=Pochonia chlamydosporia 170 TaxID=1380566 RepID=A0A179F8T9_METCM|nr:alpha/beta-Hydrolase [Pochonia chlamydosporia 170]OAQ61842.1 alpha/beta-Hydrolase [Pochonia chlamydosporia 170]
MSEDLVYALPPFETDFDVADFVDNISSRSPPQSSMIFSGTRNVTATYTIAGTFCTPGPGHKNGKSQTVLIATHGLNFDRWYWDPKPRPDLYSFVDFAINQGYSVFFYDRLGTGQSSRVSGYVAQLSNQVAILRKITHLIRNGKYLKGFGKPKSVVLVGHSFGSSLSLATITAEPSIADGLILTGYSLNATYLNGIGFFLASQPRIAAKQHPKKWRQLDTGYLTTADLYSNVNTFFKKPNYDTGISKYSENTKQPFAITELLSASAFTVQPLNYTGPTMIISGEYDFIFCTSDCNGVLEFPASHIFSKSKAFKAVSYSGAGHGLNLHLNAVGAFQEVMSFLSCNGL